MVHKTQKVSDMCRGDAKFLRYGIEPFYCKVRAFQGSKQCKCQHNLKVFHETNRNNKATEIPWLE